MQHFEINGRPVEMGEEIFDFRGKGWRYDGVGREADTGSTGRIRLVDNTVPVGQPMRTREFFPSVFDGRLVESE